MIAMFSPRLRIWVQEFESLGERQRFQYLALSLLTWRFEQNKRLVSAGKIACVGGGAIAREYLSRRVAEACNVYRPKLASVIVEDIKCWMIGIKS